MMLLLFSFNSGISYGDVQLLFLGGSCAISLTLA